MLGHHCPTTKRNNIDTRIEWLIKSALNGIPNTELLSRVYRKRIFSVMRYFTTTGVHSIWLKVTPLRQYQSLFPTHFAFYWIEPSLHTTPIVKHFRSLIQMPINESIAYSPASPARHGNSKDNSKKHWLWKHFLVDSSPDRSTLFVGPKLCTANVIIASPARYEAELPFKRLEIQPCFYVSCCGTTTAVK